MNTQDNYKTSASDSNKQKDTTLQEDIQEVYTALKARVIHPSGTFDSNGRWYAEHDDLIDVRSPSRAWPFSQMKSCRTLKYVKAIAKRFHCKNAFDLLLHV